MTKKESIGIHAIDCDNLTIENGLFSGLDKAILFENVSDSNLKNVKIFSLESIKLLDQAKESILEISRNVLSDDKRVEAIKLIDEIKVDDRATAIQKAERVIHILSSCTTLSPVIIHGVKYIFNSIFS